MKALDRAQFWRFGAVALFFGLPLLMLALAVGNFAQASGSREIAAKQDATAAQIVREVANRQAHRMRPQDTGALYLAAASPSLARAELQERAGRFVEASGGHLEEAQFTASPEQEADGTVAIQLSLTIDNKGLRDLLYAVETASPLLEATDLSAKPIDAQNNSASEEVGLLHVDLTVQGHFRKGPG